MTPTLEALRARGVLAPLDEHCANTLARLAGEERPLVVLAAALASRQVGLGHVCLDLPALAAEPRVTGEDGETIEVRWPDATTWLALLRTSPLIGAVGGERRPLLLDDAGRLYLQRYFEHEERLASAIVRRAATRDERIDEAALEAGLDRLFPRATPVAASAGAGTTNAPARAAASPGSVGSGSASATPASSAPARPAAKAKAPIPGQLELLFAARPESASGVEPSTPDVHATGGPLVVEDGSHSAAVTHDAAPEPDMQRVAARTAATRRLCVISGGPGTGKTSTVVKILALLAEQQERLAGARPLRALLLAPTGKAAMRLSESIRRAKGTIDCSDAIRAAIPEEASTIHRALGSIDGSSTCFRHDRAHPLRADVVLVDEASMVDLALMTRLVEAVPETARLILLGDKDQLASVEAGAVLGELCAATVAPSEEHPPASPAGATSPSSTAAAAAGEDGIAASIVELTRSYRYRPGSGIEALAIAINTGDTSRALAILDDPAYPDAQRLDPLPGVALSEPLRRAALDGFRQALHEVEPLDRLRALERFRILCAQRHGPHGVVQANAEIESLLVAEREIVRDVALAYVGRPVIVTRNDYQLQLFNGDVGTIVEQEGKRLAFFVGADGAPRALSPARLPPHETVFAMTVHKSQGSEFDRVAVLLGERSSPLLTRELLYTAVTRARESVTLHASVAVVAEAIARRTERGSGLRDALRGTR